jgi:hypothetical protein
MKYRYHLAFVALVLAVLIPYMVYGQAASLPFQLQWGEAVQGGQVMANDTHIVNKFDAAIASVSGSPANVAAHIASTGTDVHDLGTMAIQPATNYIASTAIRAEIDADVATVAGDLSAHSNAVTAVHGAAAGTRFLTASETILDAQIPAAIARDVEIPRNASFTFAGLTGNPTTISGFGLTDAASTTLVTDHTGDSSDPHGATLTQTDVKIIKAESTIQVAEATIASGAHVALESLFTLSTAAKGTLDITEYGGDTGADDAIGVFQVKGAGKATAEIWDPNTKMSTATGTANSVNVIEDGDDTYTIQNLFRTTTFIVTFRGRK